MVLNGGRSIKRILLAGVAAVFMAAPVASAAALEVNLEASATQVGPGSSELEFVFFSVEQLFGASMPTPSDFYLEADSMRVEVDQSSSVRVAGYYHQVIGNATINDYQDTRVHGSDNRDGFRLMVLPTEDTQLRVESKCAAIVPSEADLVHRDPLAANPKQRAVEVDVSQALDWRNCGSAELTFSGDFVMSLWEWDFWLTSTTGDQEYQTGHLQHELTAGVPGDPDAVGERREAWVFIRNGTLSLSLERDSPHILYAQPSMQIQTSGFLFQNADGAAILEQSTKILQGDVYMQGFLDANLATSAAGLHASVQGEFSRITVDQEPLFLPANQIPEMPVPDVAQVLAAGGVLGLIALALLYLIAPQLLHRNLRYARAKKIQNMPGARWRERHGTAFTVLASNAIERGHFVRAKSYCALASLHIRHPQITVLHTQIAHQREKHVAAHTHHRKLDGLLRDSRREQFRNAWEAYQAFYAKERALAAIWRDRARQLDPVEFLRRSRCWVDGDEPEPGHRLGVRVLSA